MIIDIIKKPLSIFMIFAFVLIFNQAIAISHTDNFQKSEKIKISEIEIVTEIDEETGSMVKISGFIIEPIEQLNESLPLLIMPTSWGMDKQEYLIQARKFAEDGYIVFTYTPRGWGESTGMITVAGEEDMSDFSQILDWLLQNTSADINNIGVTGISYGGGIALLVAAHDQRVKTVMAMSGWADLVACLYDENTPRQIWGGLLVLIGELEGTLDPIVKQSLVNLIKHENIEETLAWADVRSALSYIEILNQRNIPIAISSNLQDELFQPTSMVNFYQQLTTENKRLDLHKGIHFTAEASGLLGIPNKIWFTAHQWFDHYLKGIDNGINNKDKATFEIKNTRQVVKLSDWPSNQINQQAFYLGYDAYTNEDKHIGELSDTRFTVNHNHSSSTNIHVNNKSGASTGVPIFSPLLEAHTPHEITIQMKNIHPDTAMVFYSKNLDETKIILGNPQLRLYLRALNELVQPDILDFEVVAYLYDVDSNGTGTLITHGPLTRHSQEYTQLVTYELITAAYQIDKGHKIALVVDTNDAPYASPPNEGSYLEFDFFYNIDESIEPKLVLPFLN